MFTPRKFTPRAINIMLSEKKPSPMDPAFKTAQGFRTKFLMKCPRGIYVCSTEHLNFSKTDSRKKIYKPLVISQGILSGNHMPSFP